jgi:hypothetical protein
MKAAWHLAALALTLALGACGDEPPDWLKSPVLPEDAKIMTGVLFPSNERVMTTYCPAGLARTRKCHLVAWGLDGGNLKVYRKPAHHSWLRAMFSPDGKEVVFELNDTGRYSTKLAIMDLATEHWRIVEDSDSYKLWPSYHPNGGKLIFATVSQTPDNTKTRTRVRVAGVDIYSLDLKTGKTKTLTDFDFRATSRPYYTGRGDEFVFAGDMSGNIFFNPKDPRYLSDGNYWEFRKKYGDNGIILINENKNDWRPEFVMDNDISNVARAYSGSPIPANNGHKLYFGSNKGTIGKLVNPPKTQGIWARENGKNKKVTYFNTITNGVTHAGEFTLSNDESFFLFYAVASPINAGEPSGGLWRVAVDGSNPRRIPIPWAQLASITELAGGRK